MKILSVKGTKLLGRKKRLGKIGFSWVAHFLNFTSKVNNLTLRNRYYLNFRKNCSHFIRNNNYNNFFFNVTIFSFNFLRNMEVKKKFKKYHVIYINYLKVKDSNFWYSFYKGLSDFQCYLKQEIESLKIKKILNQFVEIKIFCLTFLFIYFWVVCPDGDFRLRKTFR